MYSQPVTRPASWVINADVWDVHGPPASVPHSESGIPGLRCSAEAVPDCNAGAAEPVPEKSVPRSAEPQRESSTTAAIRLDTQANAPQLFSSRNASELKHILRWIEEGEDY
ncbi:hypothetical protein Slin15195_G118850 [Septoria linicola]|uniref:Uncharacterized protein n=1 Tax=Septoria linicola TaxID=215465 RepID=A0A9Q9B7M1_9PEZI|nr:hypothetical protein Slin15195_G118850 [Septoria linicola]